MQGFCSFISIVHIFIHLGYQISFPEAFTEPCNASLQTIKNVTKCPANRSSFETAARRKNCSSLAGEARNCKSFQYHCVLGIDLKSAIELCAPSINIIDHVCTTFSSYYKSIIRVHELTCSECPWSYNSTNAYQYQQCYTYIYMNRLLTSELTTSTLQSNRSASHCKEESEDLNGNTHGVVIFAVTALTCIMIVLVGSTVAVCRRRRFGGPANAEPNELILLDLRPAHVESRSAEGQSSISSGDGLLKKPQKVSSTIKDNLDNAKSVN
eukprot:XP_019924593.1 PREDICTED: uncharacterized protein LOC105332542 isoform X1 [Crassostrea gigas]